MPALAGIDEAGFGPLLGPLVVSCSVFSVPETLIDADLWTVLRKSTADTRKHQAGRVLITDSKKAYSKSVGIKHLHRTTLACLRCVALAPANVFELLDLLCPDCPARLEAYPWHNNKVMQKPLAAADDMEIASSVLKDDLAANKMKLLRLGSRCLDVAYYNNRIDQVKNKASVLFTATCELIKQIWDSSDEQLLQIIIDRQGGRVHYRRNLQRMFPDMELKILKENPMTSSYELTYGERKMRLAFTVNADSRFLPVSLASMVSKYVRELLIGNINSHFAALYPDIKPTAGYWKDGLRFIDDLKKYIPHVEYEKKRLIRSR